MAGANVIWWMIGACIVASVALVFSRQLKILIKVLINSALGIIGLFITNMLTSLIGITVGINFFTVLLTGILGIPGLISLYLMRIIL